MSVHPLLAAFNPTSALLIVMMFACVLYWGMWVAYLTCITNV